MLTSSCKSCYGQIITAQKTQKLYQPIDKGVAGPGLLCKIATDKFWLHLPLYRQEQVFDATNILVNRSSMCRWRKGVADLAQSLVRRMTALSLQSRVVQSDATLPDCLDFTRIFDTLWQKRRGGCLDRSLKNSSPTEEYCDTWFQSTACLLLRCKAWLT